MENMLFLVAQEESNKIKATIKAEKGSLNIG